MKVKSYIIHKAAEEGDIETLKTCLLTDVDPNLQDEQGDTPFIVAARSGKKECLEWLIHYGAKKDLPNHAGHTAVNIAAANNHIDCLTFLIEEAHCTVDSPAQNGTTALFIAAWEGHSACVEYLLTKGADPNVIALENKETPLTIAATEAKLEVIKVLLNNPNIEINYKNRSGQSASSIALEQDRPDCVSLLRGYGTVSESSAKNRYQLLPPPPEQPDIAAASLKNPEGDILHPFPQNH